LYGEIYLLITSIPKSPGSKLNKVIHRIELLIEVIGWIKIKQNTLPGLHFIPAGLSFKGSRF
jgi:hypothetical protein